jgi:hypothetical protein
VQGLTERSRRPNGYANQLPFQAENYILNLKREHPSRGARKTRERLSFALLVERGQGDVDPRHHVAHFLD